MSGFVQFFSSSSHSLLMSYSRMLQMGAVKVFFLLVALGSAFCDNTCEQEEILNENLKKLAMANNHLAVNLYQKMAASSEENLFFSPFTISSVLTMLYKGTKSETAEELSKLLGFDTVKLENDVISDIYHFYLVELLNNIDPKTCTITSASALVVDGTFPLNRNYKKYVKDSFQAYIYDEGIIRDGKAVLEKLNAWAKMKTNGTIKSLVDYIDPATAFILVSAAYFKGTWKVRFDPEDTKYHYFYNRGNVFDRSEVLMMHASTSYRYYEEEDEFAAIEMTYEGRNFTMMIFLPEKLGGLRELERDLTPAKIAFIRRFMHYTKVHLTLPKFKQGFNRDLSKELKELGVNKVFSLGADLSGMMEGKTHLVVDEVRHKALIDINEEGSVAAAISSVIMTKMIPIDYVPEFKVDHPFLFVILEARSGMILFMGRINQL